MYLVTQNVFFSIRMLFPSIFSSHLIIMNPVSHRIPSSYTSLPSSLHFNLSIHSEHENYFLSLFIYLYSMVSSPESGSCFTLRVVGVNGINYF